MNDFFDEFQETLDEEANLMRTPPVTLRNTKPFTDDDVMTFGKYKGMQVKDVPSSYLLWWFDQSPTHCRELVAYVAKNKTQLEEEAEVLSGRHHSGVDNRWDQEDDDWGDRW